MRLLWLLLRRIRRLLNTRLPVVRSAFRWLWEWHRGNRWYVKLATVGSLLLAASYVASYLRRLRLRRLPYNGCRYYCYARRAKLKVSRKPLEPLVLEPDESDDESKRLFRKQHRSRLATASATLKGLLNRGFSRKKEESVSDELMRRVEFLSRTRFVACLGIEGFLELLPYTAKRKLKKGERLVSVGDPVGKAMFLVSRGKLGVFNPVKRGSQRRRPLCEVMVGDSCGEFGLLVAYGRSSRSLSSNESENTDPFISWKYRVHVEALEDSELYVLTRVKFESYCTKFPTQFIGFVKAVVARQWRIGTYMFEHVLKLRMPRWRMQGGNRCGFVPLKELPLEVPSTSNGRMKNGVEILRLRPGQRLFSHGDDAECFYIVLDGVLVTSGKCNQPDSEDDVLSRLRDDASREDSAMFSERKSDSDAAVFDETGSYGDSDAEMKEELPPTSGRIPPGCLCGAMSFFSGVPRDEAVEVPYKRLSNAPPYHPVFSCAFGTKAQYGATVARIDLDTYNRLYAERPEKLLGVARAVARQLSWICHRFFELGLQTHWYNAGSMVYRTGDVANDMYMVISGKVRLLGGDVDLGRASPSMNELVTSNSQEASGSLFPRSSTMCGSMGDDSLVSGENMPDAVVKAPHSAAVIGAGNAAKFLPPTERSQSAVPMLRGSVQLVSRNVDEDYANSLFLSRVGSKFIYEVDEDSGASPAVSPPSGPLPSFHAIRARESDAAKVQQEEEAASEPKSDGESQDILPRSAAERPGAKVVNEEPTAVEVKEEVLESEDVKSTLPKPAEPEDVNEQQSGSAVTLPPRALQLRKARLKQEMISNGLEMTAVSPVMEFEPSRQEHAIALVPVDELVSTSPLIDDVFGRSSKAPAAFPRTPSAQSSDSEDPELYWSSVRESTLSKLRSRSRSVGFTGAPPSANGGDVSSPRYLAAGARSLSTGGPADSGRSPVYTPVGGDLSTPPLPASQLGSSKDVVSVLAEDSILAEDDEFEVLFEEAEAVTPHTPGNESDDNSSVAAPPPNPPAPPLEMGTPVSSSPMKRVCPECRRSGICSGTDALCGDVLTGTSASRGESFGEGFLYGKREGYRNRRRDTALCLRDSEVVRISAEALTSLLQRIPSLAVGISRLHSRRMLNHSRELKLQGRIVNTYLRSNSAVHRSHASFFAQFTPAYFKNLSIVTILPICAPKRRDLGARHLRRRYVSSVRIFSKNLAENMQTLYGDVKIINRRDAQSRLGRPGEGESGRMIRALLASQRMDGTQTPKSPAELLQNAQSLRKKSEGYSFLQASQFARWVTTYEESHRFVVLVGSPVEDEEVKDPGVLSWNKMCLNHADLVLCVAVDTPECSGEPSEMERSLLWKDKSMVGGCACSLLSRIQCKEMVILHDQTSPYPLPRNTRRFLDPRPFSFTHHHMRTLVHADYRRLCRHIGGDSLAVVLSGGGARGLAHLGVLRSLEENHVPIDAICGTSQGAFMAALYAQHLSTSGMERMLPGFCSIFRKSSLLRSLTVPIMSYFSGITFGRGISEALRRRLPSGSDGFESFGCSEGDDVNEVECSECVRVEDLWIPYFAVSTDITDAEIRLHMRGHLVRGVTASMSILGYLPPVISPHDGHALVDGGYVDNLPVTWTHGFVQPAVCLAADVEDKDNSNFTHMYDYGPGVYGVKVLFYKIFRRRARKVPNFQRMLLWLTCITHARLVREMNKPGIVDVYIRPRVEQYGILDYLYCDALAQKGHKAGVTAMRAWLRYLELKGRSLFPLYFEPRDPCVVDDSKVFEPKQPPSLPTTRESSNTNTPAFNPRLPTDVHNMHSDGGEQSDALPPPISLGPARRGSLSDNTDLGMSDLGVSPAARDVGVTAGRLYQTRIPPDRAESSGFGRTESMSMLRRGGDSFA